jgi:hypothetical protein
VSWTAGKGCSVLVRGKKGEGPDNVDSFNLSSPAQEAPLLPSQHSQVLLTPDPSPCLCSLAVPPCPCPPSAPDAVPLCTRYPSCTVPAEHAVVSYVC